MVSNTVACDFPSCLLVRLSGDSAVVANYRIVSLSSSWWQGYGKFDGMFMGYARHWVYNPLACDEEAITEYLLTH